MDVDIDGFCMLPFNHLLYGPHYIDVDVDMDIDADMAVSMYWGSL